MSSSVPSPRGSAADHSSAGTPADEAAGGSKGLSGVGISSLIAAGSGYLVLFIAARSLTKAENAAFLTYWAALFFVIGILAGIINESTRAVSRAALEPGRKPGPRVVQVGLGIGVAVALVIGATSPFWGRHVFPTHTWLLVLAIAVTAVAYAGHASLAGAAGGLQKWGLFARLAGLEAVVRLVVVAAVSLTAFGLVGIELACIAGAFVWILFLLTSPGAREAAGARSDVPRRELIGRMGHSLTSAAATATLITGYPIMLKLTTPAAEYALAAPLILAISLTRAPIMLPLQAFQAVLITRFVTVSGPSGASRLVKPLALILGAGVVGAGLAALLGPPIMLIFGADYVVSALTMAILTIGAALMAALTLTGTVCLAVSAHRAYALGWVIATLTAFALLLTDLPLEQRVYLSLVIGPLVGTAVHTVAIHRRRAAPAPAGAGLPVSPAAGPSDRPSTDAPSADAPSKEEQ